MVLMEYNIQMTYLIFKYCIDEIYQESMYIKYV